jgi:hypothetical protein
MQIFLAPWLAFATALEMQAAFFRGMRKPPAEIIQFPAKRRRYRSGRRQLARDAINASIDGA